MKRIHIREGQYKGIKLFENSWNNEYEAGTDHPFFVDPKTGEVFEANWDEATEYGVPFGYWPYNANYSMGFFVGQPRTTHVNPCGQAAKEYFESVLRYDIEDEAEKLEDYLKDLIDEVNQYNMRYNEGTDTYISEDGSYEFTIDDKVGEICEFLYRITFDDIDYYVRYALENMTYPTSSEILEQVMDSYIEEYDGYFTEEKEISRALEVVGTDFNSFFQDGHSMGRIWPKNKMIGFYTSEQPTPDLFREILYNLSQNEDVGDTYNNMLGYTIVFEDPRNDWNVTACTVSSYISGDYGDEDDEDEEEDIEYSRGETKFVPHLANQQQKREFFNDFRNTRDRAVYVPRERAAGSLARYHAMRYPYGENKKKIGKIIREEINKIL